MKLKREVVGIVKYNLELTESELLTIVKALGKTNEDKVSGSWNLYIRLVEAKEQMGMEGEV